MLMKNSEVCSYCCFADWKPTLMLLRKSEKPPPLFGRRHLDIKTVMTWSQAFHYVVWEMMTQWHVLSNGWITAFSWCDKKFICGVLHFWRWNWVPSFHQAMKCLGGQHRFKRSYKSILSIWWKVAQQMAVMCKAQLIKEDPPGSHRLMAAERRDKPESSLTIWAERKVCKCTVEYSLDVCPMDCVRKVLPLERRGTVNIFYMCMIVNKEKCSCI